MTASQVDPIAAPAAPPERRLAAILHADMVGYSRLMELDEAGTLAALREIREGLVAPEVTAPSARACTSALPSAAASVGPAAAGRHSTAP